MVARHTILVVSENCTGCLLGRLACSPLKPSSFSPSRSHVEVTRVGHAERYAVRFTSQCDRCGFCVNFCSFGAIRRGPRAGSGGEAPRGLDSACT